VTRPRSSFHKPRAHNLHPDQTEALASLHGIG